MKKLFVVGIVVIAIASMAFVYAGAKQEAETCTLTQDVQLQAQPGYDGAVLVSLDKGQSVTLTNHYASKLDGSQGFWMEVQAEGQTGWVSVKACEPLEPGYGQLP